MNSASVRGIDRPVSRLGLGTMMFGEWGNPDRNECRRIADAALHAGINLFDTADVYDRGTCEEIVGEIIAGRRHRIVLATKCGNPMGDDRSRAGLSARWITAACDDSLRRLGVDHIDLFQMHRPDDSVPLLDSITAMNQLIAQGKILAYGTSTFGAARISQILQLCREHHLQPPATEQPPYSILCRGVESAVVPLCQAEGIGLVTWAPLNGGWLTGKYLAPATSDSRALREADHFDYLDDEVRRRKTSLVAALTELAAAAGLGLVDLAVRFVLSQPVVSSCLIGPRTPEQATVLCSIEPTPLPGEVLAAIDQVVSPGRTVNPRDDG